MHQQLTPNNDFTYAKNFQNRKTIEKQCQSMEEQKDFAIFKRWKVITEMLKSGEVKWRNRPQVFIDPLVFFRKQDHI